MSAATITYRFRLVLRGTNAEGVRVRRVKTVDAPSFEDAWASFEGEHRVMTKGLRDVRHAVYPPVGWKLDGTISKGFEVAEA